MEARCILCDLEVDQQTANMITVDIWQYVKVNNVDMSPHEWIAIKLHIAGHHDPVAVVHFKKELEPFLENTLKTKHNRLKHDLCANDDLSEMDLMVKLELFREAARELERYYTT